MKSRIIKFSAIALTAGMAFVTSCKDDDPALSVSPNVSEAVFTSNGLTLTSGSTTIADGQYQPGRLERSSVPERNLVAGSNEQDKQHVYLERC